MKDSNALECATLTWRRLFFPRAVSVKPRFARFPSTFLLVPIPNHHIMQSLTRKTLQACCSLTRYNTPACFLGGARYCNYTMMVYNLAVVLVVLYHFITCITGQKQ